MGGIAARLRSMRDEAAKGGLVIDQQQLAQLRPPSLDAKPR